MWLFQFTDMRNSNAIPSVICENAVFTQHTCLETEREVGWVFYARALKAVCKGGVAAHEIYTPLSLISDKQIGQVFILFQKPAKHI